MRNDPPETNPAVADIIAKGVELRALLVKYQAQVGAGEAQRLGGALLPVARMIENVCDGVSPGNRPGYLAPVLPLAQSKLTPRMTTIARLIGEGRSNKEMANELNLSVKTIETHRMHLMQRLDVHDVAAVVRFAIRTGLVREDRHDFSAVVASAS